MSTEIKTTPSIGFSKPTRAECEVNVDAPGGGAP